MRKRQIMAAANDEAIPCSEPLGPKQQEAIDGPDCGPDMKNFTCNSCGNTFPDTRLYFYEVVSNRCLWCTKFPKERTNKR
jgi:hypothetical protein